MKIRVSFSRKIGLPEYSSAGASTEIEIELPDSLGAEGLVSQARALYATARRSVEEQLHELDGAPPAADVAPPKPPAAPARANGHQFVSEQARYNPGPRPGATEGLPTARQFYKQLKTAEEQGAGPLATNISRWGKAQGFDGRICDWSPEQVAAALEELQQVAQLEQTEPPVPAARPYRRPTPIGRGFGHRN